MLLILLFSFFLNTVRAEDCNKCVVTKSSGIVAAVNQMVGINEMKVALEKKGMKCEPPSEERGLHCRGPVSGYPLPVNFYIPWNYKSGTPVETILHLHGWNINGDAQHTHFKVADGTGDFGKFLTQSGRNAILIAPESTDRNETHHQHFDSVSKFNGFFDHTMGLLHEARVVPKTEIDKLIATTHSGGYAVLAQTLRLKPAPPEDRYLSRIQAVGFFDSVYGREAELTEGAKVVLSRPGGAIYSVFIKGTRTEPGNRNLAKNLGSEVHNVDPSAPIGKGASFYQVTGIRHMQAMMDGRYVTFLESLH